MKEREDALFSNWLPRYKEQGLGFVTDGVFDEGKYLKAPVRILFILKEAVDEAAGHWDLRDVVGEGKHGYTWSNITRWTNAIFGNEKNVVKWDNIAIAGPSERAEALSQIAAINLKKSPGGSSSDMNNINEMAERNLCQQISIYEPDLIICCGPGVASIFADIVFQTSPSTASSESALVWQVTDRNIEYYDGAPSGLFSNFTPVIAFNHPQARISAHFLAFALLDAWRFIKDKHDIKLRNFHDDL